MSAPEDDWTADESFQRTLEHDIESVTSAAGSALKLDTIDARLMSFLSLRSYDSIVQRSQAVAAKRYQQHFESELNELLENRRVVTQEFGTSDDAQGTWRVNPDNLSQDELRREVRRLARKLQTVEQEIAELTAAAQQKAERLELVREQNDKLTVIRDA